MQFTTILACAAALGSAFAACPEAVLIQSAKQLTSNLINGLNQKNLGLLTGAIASTDATSRLNAFDAAQGKCVVVESTFAAFASNFIASDVKFVEAAITDAYQTAVGYTVVMARTKDDAGNSATHQFQYMDPTGTCTLQLIYSDTNAERCAVPL